MAFVGLIVGAGFASGQEMLQYFVAFGRWGVLGAVIAGVLMALTGMICLQLGSYFQADEHLSVLEKVTFPWMSRILDIAVSITLFSVGFVMFAGAGSNLEQEFGLDVWVGAVLMVVMVLAAGMLDVGKVSNVMGAATPVIIVFLAGACIYAMMHSGESLSTLEPVANELPTSLPNWFISSMNYVGFCLMVAISMAIVMGGDNVDPRSSAIGGLAGGTIYGILLTLCTVALFSYIKVVKDEDMPTLAIVQEINPSLGTAMALVIYIMIFNTAIGMFYALAKRLAKGDQSKFQKWLFILVGVGFVLSFIGFRQLVAYVYPALGYIGVALIVVLIVAWWRGRSMIKGETERRIRIRELMAMRFDPNRPYSREEAAEMRREIASSNIEDEELLESITEEVRDELEDTSELDESTTASAEPEAESDPETESESEDSTSVK
ncbi:hypothetical protein [Corynebacterium sp. TAE3-ERU2]|uniref:YkvI family membrane protein n=1 Tax=Corynebacterium sp. TAE3-ERU2 TaxID=2849497 RepID=UPI001C47254B|nr:hypothetical protein [Corynebacterium sp. TAE3-ERU2]MBV7301957.1 hypothetical protein [Corynebacterium sp. TAE3-ERU2]